MDLQRELQPHDDGETISDGKDQKNEVFSQQEIDSLKAFSDILKRIHIRLISEGYTLKDGKMYRPVENIELNGKVDT